ncbi:MAG: hypothetical protein BWY42_00638 [Candidatus Omnitrophica bacterium ADurb.Bin277]|nr:MAG: hypothetical protein BWY42_00638 [Candidatus Omnitrophica bacterium ADurb.Bin277]
MVKRTIAWLPAALMLAGCLAQSSVEIPGVPGDHPAQDFYRFVSQNLVSDKVCRDHRGNPDIPMGKLSGEEGYTKLEDLAAGVFRFRERATGKKYLGVTFLQYHGLLKIPKLCSWEENDQGQV